MKILFLFILLYIFNFFFLTFHFNIWWVFLHQHRIFRLLWPYPVTSHLCTLWEPRPLLEIHSYLPSSLASASPDELQLIFSGSASTWLALSCMPLLWAPWGLCWLPPSNVLCVCARMYIWLCQTFYGPMDCSLPGSSIHGFFQARILKRVGISSSRGSSWPRYQNPVSGVSCLGRWVLYYRAICCLGISQFWGVLFSSPQVHELLKVMMGCAFLSSVKSPAQNLWLRMLVNVQIQSNWPPNF